MNSKTMPATTAKMYSKNLEGSSPKYKTSTLTEYNNFEAI